MRVLMPNHLPSGAYARTNQYVKAYGMLHIHLPC
ncbi:hypothetical protein J2Z21_008782 [Streptomyces griseochromogenes]|uniref:Uncharacterized protein n=1 Tax=Streptomyces griseochromogenes TaxID=68214 RepID=A0ABS4M7W3_9ACTN|nr:hypothetical protein [Streptomyces griseochromogenes]